MSNLAFPVKVLIFVGYVLAVLVPVLSFNGQQTQAEHAQMMTMAGHEMTVAAMGNPKTDEAQMFLCKQHCLVATATLPVAEQSVEIIGHVGDVEAGNALPVSSLVFPPPSHPPQVAEI